MIAKYKKRGDLKEAELQASKCGDVEPELKILQVFVGDEHEDFECEDDAMGYDSTNLMGLVQELLRSSPYPCSVGMRELGKLSVAAVERFERSSGNIKTRRRFGW